MDAGSAACTYAQQALADAFEAEPVNQGQGGSIPFIPEFLRLFPECQVLVTGPEDPQSNAHSPNESQSISALRKSIIAEAFMLQDFASLNI